MKRFRNNYTLIEILVVLGIMAILAAIGTSGIRGLAGSAGVTGAVRNLGSQLSMARSYAVSHNRYVAVLFPDDPSIESGTNTSVNFGNDYLYRQSRLCYVTNSGGTYNFDSWIPDSTWQTWPAGTAVCGSTNVAQVQNVDSTSGKNSAAVVYRPSGTLSNISNAVTMLVFRAKYDPDKGLVYGTKETRNSGWAITINPFTGNASYAKKF